MLGLPSSNVHWGRPFKVERVQSSCYAAKRESSGYSTDGLVFPITIHYVRQDVGFTTLWRPSHDPTAAWLGEQSRLRRSANACVAELHASK